MQIAAHAGAGTGLSTCRRWAGTAGQIGICASAVAPLHGTATIPEVLELIDKIGPDYMYATSDHFWDWEPPIPAQMYEYYGCLYDSGASYDDLYKISRHWKTLLKD